MGLGGGKARWQNASRAGDHGGHTATAKSGLAYNIENVIGTVSAENERSLKKKRKSKNKLVKFKINLLFNSWDKLNVSRTKNRKKIELTANTSS